MLKISDHESDNFEDDQKPNGMSNTEFKLIDYNLECLGLITDDACVGKMLRMWEMVWKLM